MGFIVIDGLDGSGKSTQANLLANYFTNKGKTVCLREHPSKDNFFGAQARRFLIAKGKNAHFASALFYMFDVLRSIALYSWRKTDYTIFVRYLMGTAYLPAPLHKIGYFFFAAIVPKSEHMIFLDVTPQEANRRIKENRTTQEMFEELHTLKKTRAKALILTTIGKWKIINANNPTPQVNQQIKKQLNLTNTA
jgi:dTMP kinase